jgi:hypothetical protein
MVRTFSEMAHHISTSLIQFYSFSIYLKYKDIPIINQDDSERSM